MSNKKSKKGGGGAANVNKNAQGKEKKKKLAKDSVYPLPLATEPPGREIPNLANDVSELLTLSVRHYQQFESVYGGANFAPYRKYQLRVFGDGAAMKELKPPFLKFLEIRLALKQLDASLRVIAREVAGRRRRLIANRRILRRGRRPPKRKLAKGAVVAGNTSATPTSATPPSTSTSVPSSTTPPSTPGTSGQSATSSRRGSATRPPADQILLPSGVKEMLKKQRADALNSISTLTGLAFPGDTPPALGKLREWLIVQLNNTVKKMDKYTFEAGGLSSSGSRS